MRAEMNFDSPSAALSIDEAAYHLRISRAGLWRLLKDGRLPKAKVGGRTLVRRRDLEAFLDQCVEVSN